MWSPMATALCEASRQTLPAWRYRAPIPPMHPLDPYRCANLLIREHGADAEVQAAMRADELDAAGDEAGRRAWMCILAALDNLRRVAPKQGERVQ